MVKIVQACVGALTVLLAAAIARRVGGDRAAVAAAALCAVYPSLVWTPAYVFSETLYSAMALGCAAWLERERATGKPAWRLTAVGALAGIATLTRPAMLVFVALALPWLWWRRGLLAACAFALGTVLIVAPWTARTRRYGRVVLVASEGGITFWTGNHPLAIGEGDLAANPDLKRANVALREAHPGLTAEQLEPIYYREAWSFIRQQPLSWAWLMLRKAFYTVVPIGPSYRLHSPLYVWASVLPYSRRCPSLFLAWCGFEQFAACPKRSSCWRPRPSPSVWCSFRRSGSVFRLSTQRSWCWRRAGGAFARIPPSRDRLRRRDSPCQVVVEAPRPAWENAGFDPGRLS